MMIEQMPEAGAREHSNVRAVIDNHVEAPGALLSNQVEESSILWFPLVYSNVVEYHD